jgi:hypothetical protein
MGLFVQMLKKLQVAISPVGSNCSSHPRELPRGQELTGSLEEAPQEQGSLWIPFPSSISILIATYHSKK